MRPEELWDKKWSSAFNKDSKTLEGCEGADSSKSPAFDEKNGS